MKDSNKENITRTQLSGLSDEVAMTEKVQALESLIDETVSFFQRLRVVAEEFYSFKRLSGGKRGVLRDLYRSGMQTVPQMARSRPVSRQHIQTIVNPLAEEGLVELIENPAHKRSKLVCLTQKGVNLVEEMNCLEIELFSGLKIDVSEQELRNSASVLRSVRELFDSEQLKELLYTIRKRREKK
jgi:DNA-binding MarR family transcriptional regulator